MKSIIVKCLILVFCLGMTGIVAEGQAKKKPAPSRTVKKRTTAKRTTNSKTKANINPAAKAFFIKISSGASHRPTGS